MIIPTDMSRYKLPHRLFATSKTLPGLIGVERIMLIYSIFSIAVLIIVTGDPHDFILPLCRRLLIAALTLMLWQVYLRKPCYALYALRVGFQLALLSFWYPDIYNCARLMGNYDHVFASIDQSLFGCQPAVEFSRVLAGRAWSELFNMGYFSYYLMLAVLMIVSLFMGYHRINSNANVIICSFCLFYVVFMFLQVAGPQFYFPVIGSDNVSKGVFPPVYDYFAYEPTLRHASEPDGFFQSLVRSVQGSERPIAAFPSSHVGIATVFLILAFRTSRRLFYVFVPFYVILCFSTVYIQAHYAIDAIAGLPAGALAYFLAHRLGRFSFLRLPKDFPHHHHHHHHHHHDEEAADIAEQSSNIAE